MERRGEREGEGREWLYGGGGGEYEKERKKERGSDMVSMIGCVLLTS